MKTTVIDLLGESKIFQETKNHKAALECKFVLLSAINEIILLLGPLREYPYHAKLVEYFCKQYAIPSGWERCPDLYEIYGSPYRVSGGGWFRFDFGKSIITAKGNSTAYGRFHSQKLKDALDTAQFVNGLQVEIKD